MQPYNVTTGNAVKCAGCGAALKFAPGTTHSLICQYCGLASNIHAGAASMPPGELDYYAYVNQENLSAAAGGQQIVTVNCSGCGSNATLNRNVTSDSCAFCGTPLIVKNGSVHSVIRPQYVLPFAVTHQQALQIRSKWAKKLWLAPEKFRKQLTGSEGLKGMYIPYWTYDFTLTTKYEAEITSAGSQFGSIRTGTVQNRFNDVRILASNSLPEKYAQRLEPWDLSGLKPYNDVYLAGFQTETYQVNLRLGLEKTKPLITPTVLNSIKKDLGGLNFKRRSSETVDSNVTFKHILLPVWLGAYKYNGKIYRVMINGQTGELQCEAPNSYLKLAAMIIAGSIIYYVANRLNPHGH